MKKVRIWLGPKEKYTVVGLSAYGDGGPPAKPELRKLVGAIELTVKMHFPHASVVRTELVEKLYT